jgi:hypothetical protein
MESREVEDVSNEQENENNSDFFHGEQFIVRLRGGGTYRVTYESECLRRLLLAFKDVASDHGFDPVDPKALLCTILGVGVSSAVYIPGPTFRSRLTYPASYDFRRQFMARDRNFIRSMLELVYCEARFCARDMETVSTLEERVVSLEFDHTKRERKIEIHYLTGLHKDDRMCVIIEGRGTEPNSFHFGHSVHWTHKRLLAPNGRMRKVRRIEASVD